MNLLKLSSNNKLRKNRFLLNMPFNKEVHMNKPKSIEFAATWDKNILSLKKKKKRYLVKKFNLFFTKLPGISHIRKKVINFYEHCIIPSYVEFTPSEIKEISNNFDKFWYSDTNHILKDHFRAIPFDIKTPDNKKIDATYLKHKLSKTEKTPLLIIFQPNRSLYKQAKINYLLEKIIKIDKPLDILFFDYRGCGLSTGKPKNAKSLMIDGASVYQMAKDYLCKKDNLIYMYGFSLGGAISAYVKKLYQNNAKYINERSFSSSEKVIKENINKSFTRLISYGANKLGWNFSIKDIWCDLLGKKLVIYHPDDPIIKNAHLAKEKNILNDKNTKFVKLTFLIDENLSVSNHHAEPLFHYQDARGNDVTNDILEFLFS